MNVYSDFLVTKDDIEQIEKHSKIYNLNSLQHCPLLGNTEAYWTADSCGTLLCPGPYVTIMQQLSRCQGSYYH